jgi:hypothetical protein
MKPTPESAHPLDHHRRHRRRRRASVVTLVISIAVGLALIVDFIWFVLLVQ